MTKKSGPTSNPNSNGIVNLSAVARVLLGAPPAAGGAVPALAGLTGALPAATAQTPPSSFRTSAAAAGVLRDDWAAFLIWPSDWVLVAALRLGDDLAIAFLFGNLLGRSSWAFHELDWMADFHLAL
ncbi:hypothetical protein Nepgr_033885 [Nepenthes gracilis]|uniref:Uncharacterized protein n=1 Tax=Nepenthes gracilis TaxID=150966 RepID=A0AAD3Y961_NEPGR|nr:hypothetical protein Nepgr_033885 [Nepenthes gracilis]